MHIENVIFLILSKNAYTKFSAVPSKIAEANKAIGNAFLNKDKISAMYDTAVKFGEGLYNLFGSDENTRATACIHGTVARVADNCTLVIYGGKFVGYGSTPNVRNAVIEVSHNRATNGIQTSSDPRYGRTQGGAVYVFDGTFTAMAGANVFNMYIVNRSENLQASVWTVQNGVVTETKVPLLPSETFGLETVTYEKVTYNGVTQDMPVDTGNIMVRGGTFQCYFEPTMMATLNPETKGTDKNDGQYCPEHDKYGDDCDDVDHNKFSGTVGSVNLGVQSFDEDMIRDGRIQLVDVYGSGRLVLLDGGDPIDPNPEDDSGLTEEEVLKQEQQAWEQAQKEAAARGEELSSVKPANTYTTNITKEGGIRKYRLFISDVELRALEYLTVHPNTAIANSTESFALQTYYGTPTDRNPKVTQPWVTDDENIRAPYSSNEGYFEFEFDDPGYSEGIFISPDLKLNGALLAGEELAQSPVWYYTIPVNAAGESLGDFSYTDTYLRTKYSTGTVEASFNRTRKSGSPAYSSEFYWGLEDFVETNTEYYKRTEEKYSTNIKFFVYKIYRVDPLSRESINESDEWSANEPLLELRYGANNDSVKCIVTLKELEKAIEKRLREKGEIGANESWSYRSGDLYRIVFSVEERLGYGYMGSQADGEVKFSNELTPASAEASILIRCVSKNEDKDSYHYNPSTGAISAAQVADWTPLQFVKKNETTGKYYKDETLKPGEYATVELINGQTGMVDWQGARIFDIYYQWYILDNPEDETPTLIAGTDNVWIAQNPYGSKQFHKPDNFLLKEDGSGLGINGEHYANTVDPNSPEATMYTYGPNGLPVNEDDVKHSPDLWTNEMLHMYTYETANSEEGMKKDKNDKLYLANNNTFWGNTDSIYIPPEYASKYLMCKVVAVNVRYPYLYDNLQTIYSHMVQIEGVPHPGFKSVTPASGGAFTMGGSASYGTGSLKDAPTFAFTANPLDAEYTKKGYSLKLTTEAYVGGELVYSAENGNAYTPKNYGDYEVIQTITIVDKNGNELNSVSYKHTFTLVWVPTITGAIYAPMAAGAEQRTEVPACELDKGEINLGVFSTDLHLYIKTDDVPKELYDKGYRLWLQHEDNCNGEIVQSYTYYLSDFIAHAGVPVGLGNHTYSLTPVLEDSEGNVISRGDTFKFNFNLSTGVDMIDMKPLPNEEDMIDGVTDLGTIMATGFSFKHALPSAMGADYRIEADIFDYHDGVLDTSNKPTVTKKYAGVWDGTGVTTLEFGAKGLGNHEVHMVLKLVNIKTGEVEFQREHIYKCYYKEVPPTGIDVEQYPGVLTLDNGGTYQMKYTVHPANNTEKKAIFTSSNPEIATVSSTGLITGGTRAGTAIITATTTCGTYSDTIAVTVDNDASPAVVSGVGLYVGEYLKTGETVPTTVKPDDGYVYLSRVNGKLTLTFHNYYSSGKHYRFRDAEGALQDAQVQVKEPVNIVIEGKDNALVTGSTSGLYLMGDATFTGSGSILIEDGIHLEDCGATFNGPNVTVNNYSFGIYGMDTNETHEGVLTFTKGTVTINSNSHGIAGAFMNGVTVNGGTLNITSTAGNGISSCGGDITISSGTVNINAAKYGINNSSYDLIVKAGKTTINAAANDAINVYQFNMSGGILLARGYQDGIDVSIDYSTNPTTSRFNLTGGALLAASTNTTSDSSYCALNLMCYQPKAVSGSKQLASTYGSGVGYFTIDMTDSATLDQSEMLDFIFLGSDPQYVGVELYGKYLFDGCRMTESGTITEATEAVSGSAFYKDGTLYMNNWGNYMADLSSMTDLTINLTGDNNLCSIYTSTNYALTIDGDGYLEVGFSGDNGIITRTLNVYSDVCVGSSGVLISGCSRVTVDKGGSLELIGTASTATGITGYRSFASTIYVKNGSLLARGQQNGFIPVISGTKISTASQNEVIVAVYGGPQQLWDGTTDLSGYNYLEIRHKHAMEAHSYVAPTCVAEGSKAYYYCAGCDTYFSNASGSTKIDPETYAPIPATGHTWQDATCTLPETCSVCALTRGEPAGHQWGVNATGDMFQCTVCGEELGAVHVHDLVDTTVTKEANCQQTGILTGTCTLCGETVEQVIDVNPNYHAQLSEATCDAPAHCAACGTDVGEALGHQWTGGSCTTPATCTVCGAVNGTAPGHVWENATCAHPKFCINCGTTEGSALAHSWKDATCDDPKTCTVCWATEGDALGHTWDVTDCTKERTCTVCGEVRAPGSHDLTITSTTDKQHTGTCDECGVSVTENHTFDSTNTCTVCGASKEGSVDPSMIPTLKGSGFTLSFEDEILVNFYYTAVNTDDILEQGMLVFYSDPGSADVAKADDSYIGSYVESSGAYIATTDGIAAKEMGDSRFYCAYAKLYDGTYAYSPLYQYSPKKYATNLLGKASTSANQKALCVAMLNYGAAAQSFFGYKTDDLMNANLTDEQKALVKAYDASYFIGTVPVDASKIGSFAATTPGFSGKSASVSFEGAFSINYYFTPSATADGTVVMYYWSPEDYKAATVLSAENATGAVPMELQTSGAYWGQVSGIAAKSLDETYYVAAVYTDANGNSCCSGIVAYSLSRYCMNNAKPGKDMQELAANTAMYGYYAKQYFAN